LPYSRARSIKTRIETFVKLVELKQPYAYSRARSIKTRIETITEADFTGLDDDSRARSIKTRIETNIRLTFCPC